LLAGFVAAGWAGGAAGAGLAAIAVRAFDAMAAGFGAWAFRAAVATDGFARLVAVRFAAVLFADFAETGRTALRVATALAGLAATRLAGFRAGAAVARAPALARFRLVAAAVRRAALRAGVRGRETLAPRSGFRLVALAGLRLAIAASFRVGGLDPAPNLDSVP